MSFYRYICRRKQERMARIHTDECLICRSTNIHNIYNAKDYTVSGESFSIAECRQCGFRFTADPPAESDCGRYYQSQDYISHSDTSAGLVNRIYHRVRKIMLGRKAGLLADKAIKKTLLDFGSGTGYFAAHMQSLGFDATGIEMDDQAREFSKRQFGIKALSTEGFLTAKFGQQFGYITLWHVLEHLYNPDRYMKAFYDLLEDNGRLIIAVPNFRGREATAYGLWWAGYDVPRHLWHFDPKSMDTFASRNGFSIIEKHDMPFDPFYNAMLSEKYQKHFFALARGFYHGFLAWLAGNKEVEKASSVIYIMEKQKR